MGDEPSTPSLGLKWCFSHTDELLTEASGKDVAASLSINEKEYFDECKKAFMVEFKKEPPKA